MSQESVERVLGRLITDEQFRRSAVESFEMACRQAGYLLTPSELQLLASLKLKHFSELSGELNPGLRRAKVFK
jgi:hypothetical protein